MGLRFCHMGDECLQIAIRERESFESLRRIRRYRSIPWSNGLHRRVLAQSFKLLRVLFKTRGFPMTTEISLNQPGMFCATVVTVFTYLPWRQLLLSALRVSKMGNLP